VSGVRDPDVLAVTWIGHSTMLLELDGLRVLTDPVLRRRVGPLTRIVPPVPPEAAERIDAVLLSHLHADHAELPSLRRISRSAAVLAPHGAGRWLTRRGVANVQEIRAGEKVKVGGLSVTATPAEHDGRRRPFGPAGEPIGFVARGSRSFYFAGDTDLFPGMAQVAGAPDLALLPVWGWGSRLGPGHLDPERAATAAALIAPHVAVPIHWGTFALARPAKRATDPARPAREFAALVARRAPGVDVRVLAPGARTEVREAQPGGAVSSLSAEADRSTG
jgi:L-ascorbate metabolism protein UlaG (beta-lactamase superfamily)